ncbi:YsnF/AvaK domain-containing protein [Antarcticibacterium sp. 1MA-6-2]|uniref:YsnF/AvaK domain-containing protein n=1 Tax=Antarcticibacterium sp. 1MA-6-2 TaxID=2908210 RepID=UPI001F428C60|nr:YsnF/AvaK domain-containing protein [Antarcticibacterium sp. 1MA-6-2]UJH92338.1 YsnF/AvaK domain-containing protein [Antarcticibacterium sp. 1MA-6-2]
MINEEEGRQDLNPAANSPKKLDVIEERLVVGKEKVETGKVVLHKRVIEEDVPLDLELFEEHMDVEVKKIGKVVDSMGPAVRQEGDTKIYSVYREVYVKQTILEEEVRITKKQTTKPFHTSETLRREVIDVERISGERDQSASQYNKRDSNRDRERPLRDGRQGDNTAFNEQGDLSGCNQLKE